MSNYTFCFSPTGGTKKVADILTAAMTGTFTFVDLCRSVRPLALRAGDVCLLCVPSYGGRVPEIALERLKCLSPNGAKAILVCVYGNRAWDDTLTELQDAAEEAGFVCVGAVAAVAEHSIFRQYAAGRPDREDTESLTAFAHKLQEKLDAGLFDPPIIPGRHYTYQKYGGVPFKPEGNKNCTACGLCAGACPAEAIDPADPRKTDKGLCISCMRCVGLCPSHARDLPPLVLKGAAAAMVPLLGGRKKNHLFL